MKNYLLPALFGTIAIVSYVLPATALSPVEIQRIAKQTTVQITECGFGSGVIIRKDGNTYTVMTAAHAVKNTGCEVTTPDNSKYQVTQIKTFPNEVDLAVFTFTSSKNYPADLNISNELFQGSWLTYAYRGDTKYHLGDYQGAIEDYDRAIAEPLFYSGLNMRGNAKYKLGDKQGAIADWRRAAKAFKRNGRTDKYQKVMRSISKGKPDESGVPDSSY